MRHTFSSLSAYCLSNRIYPPSHSVGQLVFAARERSRAGDGQMRNNNNNSMSESLSRPRNLILAQLPDAEYDALARFLVPVELPLEMRLSEPNEPIEYVYFLNTGLISTDALTEKGESVEVGVIGREGFAGLPALFDQPQMSHTVLMQGSEKDFAIRSSDSAGTIREGWNVATVGAYFCVSAIGSGYAVCPVQQDA